MDSDFGDTKQRLKDPYNYYADLKYLGLCSIISLVTFAITDYIFLKKGGADYYFR